MASTGTILLLGFLYQIKEKNTGLHYTRQAVCIIPLTEEFGMLYELFHHQVQCVPKVTTSSKYLPNVTHFHFTNVPTDLPHPPEFASI
jgi:hypothetical protein